MDPSPRGNFTPPTILECGETLGDLEPVYDLALPEVLTNTCMWRLSETGRVFWVFFRAANYRAPLPLREIHSTDETIVWRDPGRS